MWRSRAVGARTTPSASAMSSPCAKVSMIRAVAIETGDIGLLYVMGVNGQILMHYAALLGQPWDVYINAMREGVRKHGPVRGGLYTMLEDRQ